MRNLRRRDFASLTAAVPFGLARILAGPPQAGAPQRRPNIVLITGDHLRWDHVAINGNPAIITPRMDRLAQQGVTFTLCTTVGVACAPNRASLFTGRYPNAHRLMTNGIPMPENEVT